MKRNLGRQKKEDRRENNFLIVPYHMKNLNVTKKIARKSNRKLATRRNVTLFNALHNDKDLLKDQEKSGVYKIPIKDIKENESRAYIDVTSRTIKKRIEEHKMDIQNARLTTALAVEAYNSDIEIKWDEVKRIKPVPVNTQPTITEALEIIKRTEKEKLVNDKLNWEPPAAWKYALADSRV